jgi:hypothetical protein
MYVNVKNIHISSKEGDMSQLVDRIDDFGRPAWIALMVVSFIVFWPIGLGVLAFLLWSGRMGMGRGMCGRSGEMSRWQAKFAEKWERKMGDMGMQAKAYPATGNRAFDDYRAETLRRLEEEAREFRDYLERLRMAKDRAEFEQFMSERRNRPASGTDPATPSTA